jgi:hypothetical protein
VSETSLYKKNFLIIRYTSKIIRIMKSFAGRFLRLLRNDDESIVGLHWQLEIYSKTI